MPQMVKMVLAFAFDPIIYIYIYRYKTIALVTEIITLFLYFFVISC